MARSLRGCRRLLLRDDQGTQDRRPHRIEIWYAADGDTLYLLAGGGRSSDWVQNAIADPAVEVERDGSSYSAQARVLEDAVESEHARSMVFEKYTPRSSDDLREWRDVALPVALDLEVT